MALDLRNIDCMKLMAEYPNKYFDLAIVDPPYGIEINANMGRKKGKAKRHNDVKWDDAIPSDDYFKELFRVAKNQIIWGGNYFPYIWSNGCGHFIFWDKLTPEGMSFSDGELAWTSFNRAIRKYTYRNITNDKIHPTQKPIDLYRWILKTYAKEGDKILDTHLGSGSIAIACHDYKFDLVASEIDKEYYEATMKRVSNHLAQTVLF